MNIPLSDNHMHIWREISLDETVDFFEDIIKRYNYKEIAFCGINEEPEPFGKEEKQKAKMQNLKIIYLKKRLSVPVFAYAGLHLTKGDLWSDSQDFLNQVMMYDKAGFDGIKMFYNRGMYINGYPHLSYKVYEPFFSYVEKNQIPIILHIGSPEICFRKKEEIPFSQQKWYINDTRIHLYDMLRDLELVMEKFPKLKITLAHFGFLSEHIDWAEEILNKYENLNLDICPSLFMYYDFQANKKDWREFFIKYSDRIIYGTDIGSNVFDTEKKEPDALVHIVRGFFTENEIIHEFDEDFYPMTLPEDVLKKIFRQNMLRVNGDKPKEICFEALLPEVEFEEKYGEKTPLAIKNLNGIKSEFGFASII